MKYSDIENLLTWYQMSKRDLAWRKDKKFYHVWISEIMLQQTRVEAVKEYYLRFLEELPTLDSLATIEEEKLLKLWEGLGYYSRARNLKKCAQKIIQLGDIPTDYQSLMKLPGIGPYTSCAISSICFNEKVPAIDGNVFRVMMRYLGLDMDITLPKTRTFLFSELSKCMPDEAGDFNQALMELGATICIPNSIPKCEKCPLQKNCIAKKLNLISKLPNKPMKKKRKIEEKTILLFINYDEVAIIKRADKGLLAGLYSFPSLDYHATREEVLNYVKEQQMDALRIVELEATKHIFTHLEWHMIGYIIFVSSCHTNYLWTNYRNLKNNYALPTAFLKYEDRLEEIIRKEK